MPKSDTWPGGTGLEMMTGMDSAGSCDSVVSANSEFSDDSLDHLSAEEKACLMFLEETIESLDTEEDSGMSNDEPDQLPAHGNLATKMANLSASMENSKLNSPSKHHNSESTKETSKHHSPKQSYLVPTPIVVANSSECFLPRPSLSPDKKNIHTIPQAAASNNKPGPQHDRQHNATRVPTEVNVVVIPPPSKPKDHEGRIPSGPSPARGPLSYEGLVHLRRSASEKKSPLCPTVDHTIDLDKPIIRVARYPSHSDHLHRSPSGAAQESLRPKNRPPAVAPKPKMIPAHVVIKTQTETAVPNADTSLNCEHSSNHQKVRLEALQKLGLLPESPNEDISARSLSKTPSWDLNSYRFIRDPIYSNPSRSPSFSYSQTPTEPRARPVQSSASFHHYSRAEPRSVSPSRPVRPGGGRVPTRERSGAGNQTPFHPNPQLHPSTMDGQRSRAYSPQGVLDEAPELAKNTAAPQTVPPKPSTPQRYSVKAVSGMGADRREALRKLGLLKE